jgi:pimeloyl-ACP methyl ester carboxylesterase
VPDQFPLRVQREKFGGMMIAAIVAPGSGRPVVFVHGNSSTKAVWANQITFIRQQGRPCLALDLPGHGDSDDSHQPDVTYNLPGYSTIVRALLDRLGWTAVDVVGWSLGGHIGLELLASDTRLRSLLIVGTPPGRPCAQDLLRAFYDCPNMQLACKPVFSDNDAVAYGSAMMGGREYLTPQLLACIKRTDGKARQRLFASVINGVGSDQGKTVATSSRPLCIVHGEREPFVRLDYLRSLHYRALWRSRIHVIHGAGHAPHWQKADLFNRILLTFLQFAELG